MSVRARARANKSNRSRTGGPIDEACRDNKVIADMCVFVGGAARKCSRPGFG